jgi:hypothetical protein
MWQGWLAGTIHSSAAQSGSPKGCQESCTEANNLEQMKIFLSTKVV